MAGAERRGGAVEDFDVGPLTFADIKELVGVIDPNEWELLEGIRPKIRRGTKGL